jgi:hypothetical protein
VIDSAGDRRDTADREKQPHRADHLQRLLDNPVTALIPWFGFAFLLEPLGFLRVSLLAFGLSCCSSARPAFGG